jgi:hypothetical protein
LLRRLRDEEPEVWSQVLDLREGVRSAKTLPGSAGKKIVVCRAGNYVQLYLAEASGKILSRDPSVILPVMESAREIPAPQVLPAGHNDAVMKVREEFAREVKMRQAQRESNRRATTAQKWVSEHLLQFYRLTEDPNLKTQIQTVEAALRADGLPLSVKRELTRLHKNKIAGEDLWHETVKIYTYHDLKNRPQAETETPDEWPQIVCSMALM